jgi:hypothetical protein
MYSYALIYLTMPRRDQMDRVISFYFQSSGQLCPAPDPNPFLASEHISPLMKLTITISCPKVHDVGYRVFLLKHAMNLTLPGLSTYNWEENGQHEVIALV